MPPNSACVGLNQFEFTDFYEFCFLVTRSLNSILQSSGMTLDNNNRARNAFVELRRNPEMERLLILQRPVQRITNRKYSVQFQQVDQSIQPIIRSRSRNNASLLFRPIIQRPPERRPSSDTVRPVRPNLDDFLNEFARTEQMNQIQMNQPSQRNSFYSRGR